MMKCLNEFYDGARDERVRQLHRRAFAWEPQGRIPLGIHVAHPQYSKELTYDRWLDPKPFFEVQVRYLADTLAVGSDLLPVVAINHLGTAPSASMFGCKMFLPDQTSATLQDVGPEPLPVLSSIDQAADLEMPSPDAGIILDVENMLRYYRNRLPEWVCLVPPMPTAPFSTAMALRGSQFLVELIDAPDLCKRLILLCAELEGWLDRRFRRITTTPGDRYPTNFAVDAVGVRLGDDSICNLSPQMIWEFCGPAYRRVCEICGGAGHVHFCSLPHSRFEHLYGALLETDGVDVVSSQFGFEYYANHLDELRGRLAVECFYGDAYAYVCGRYGSFRDWARDFVPRYKNESGLVLYLQVSSVEEGEDVWANWQEAHEK